MATPLSVVQALQLVISLTNTGLSLLTAAKEAADVIRKAQAEGRDVTDEELQGLVEGDDRARALLESAIEAAQHSPE